jgi:hypothetical protein
MRTPHRLAHPHVGGVGEQQRNIDHPDPVELTHRPHYRGVSRRWPPGAPADAVVGAGAQR